MNKTALRSSIVTFKLKSGGSSSRSGLEGHWPSEMGGRGQSDREVPPPTLECVQRFPYPPISAAPALHPKGAPALPQTVPASFPPTTRDPPLPAKSGSKLSPNCASSPCPPPIFFPIASSSFSSGVLPSQLSLPRLGPFNHQTSRRTLVATDQQLPEAALGALRRASDLSDTLTFSRPTCLLLDRQTRPSSTPVP
jgi:hypothetical protein